MAEYSPVRDLREGDGGVDDILERRGGKRQCQTGLNISDRQLVAADSSISMRTIRPNRKTSCPEPTLRNCLVHYRGRLKDLTYTVTEGPSLNLDLVAIAVSGRHAAGQWQPVVVLE